MRTFLLIINSITVYSAWGITVFLIPVTLSFRASSAQYTHGITTSVNIVEVTSPPITASAIGDLSEALSPKPNVRGNNARIVVILVMIIGLIL